MSTDWMKYKKQGWPVGSLERQLLMNYPGCKTLMEAVAKAIRDSHELKELKEQLAKSSAVSDVKPDPGVGEEW